MPIDKATRPRVAERGNPSPSPPLIRAMAKTLHDHDVDPHDDPVRLITTLITAGFSSNDITVNWDGVLTMAMIRQRNEERR